MAPRTLADFVKEGQQSRLERVFREELLKIPCDEGGPQRMVENEDSLREILQMMLRGLAEPYYKFVGPEVEVTTDYSVTLFILINVNDSQSVSTPVYGVKKLSQLHTLRLVAESDNCPTDQSLIRTLRGAGWEYADAWDLRAFLAKHPEIPDSPTGQSIYAPGTVTQAGKAKPVLAHFDRVARKWVFGSSDSLFGPLLVRRIEK